MDIVFFDEICWQVAEFNSHILAAFKRLFEIDLFCVNGYELGARCGDNTVEKDLEGEKIDRGCFTISMIIYSVSDDGRTCSVRILLLWYVIYNNPVVRHVFPTRSGYVLFVYEKNVSVISTRPNIPCARQPD